MPSAQAHRYYAEALTNMQAALRLCDEEGIGRAASPHLDLAINLLTAEFRASKALAQAQDQPAR